jgi:hypothetical protein
MIIFLGGISFSYIFYFKLFLPDLFYGCVVQVNLNKVQDVHNLHIEEGEDANPSQESCSFLPCHPFYCEEEGYVTKMFFNESFVDLSTFMNNKELFCCSNQLVEIEDNKCNETKNVSGFHLYIEHISFRVVNNSNIT